MPRELLILSECTDVLPRNRCTPTSVGLLQSKAEVAVLVPSTSLAVLPQAPRPCCQGPYRAELSWTAGNDQDRPASAYTPRRIPGYRPAKFRPGADVLVARGGLHGCTSPICHVRGRTCMLPLPGIVWHPPVDLALTCS